MVTRKDVNFFDTVVSFTMVYKLTFVPSTLGDFMICQNFFLIVENEFDCRKIKKINLLY